MVGDTTTPRNFGPCGTVLDQDKTLLFRNADRYYTQFAGVEPPLIEALLVPFHVGGKAVGTVWAATHDDTRAFDAEDQRLLESLAMFAATAYQARLLITAQAKSNQGLQEADRRKSDFMAMLAHELRNPIAPIRNAVEILRRSGADETKVQLATEMMHRQVGQMVRLINDLIDITRISRGSIEVLRQPVALMSVVNQAAEAIRPICDHVGQVLDIFPPAQPIYVNADQARLAQVIGNLLHNASKFSARDANIRMTISEENERAVIRVKDFGIGLSIEQIPSIFAMFAQVDTSLMRTQDGLGIGLSLVRSLIELHEGTVEVTSAGLGQGSEFIIRMPMLADTPVETQPVAKTVAAPRKILIVDDNRDAAISLALLLKMIGHEVFIAHDGEEAIEAAAAIEPDAVLLDIGLPKLNGYEVARRIREQKRDRALRLIALTGWGQEEDRILAREAGFDAHMVKPVDIEVLSGLLVETAAS
jgi:signal transduction histidine kinase/ActR/RegA family two-component response regulator